MKSTPTQSKRTGVTLLTLAGLFGAGIVTLYSWNLGVGNFIGTAACIGLCTAAIFRRRFWRFCVSAWTRYRSGVCWSSLANWSLITCALHGLLIVAQRQGVIVEHGVFDLSELMVSLEGHLHLAFPNPMPLFLSWIGLAIYMCAFPALMLSMIIVLDGCREESHLCVFLIACLGVSLFALPAFALVGVPEVWIVLEGYRPPAVEPGEGMAFYRTLSGPYNCLPSLHNTLTMVAMGTAWRTGMPALRFLVLPLGSLICLSTVFNGIHWVVDVLSSAPLAALAIALAVKFHARTEVVERT